MTVEAAQGRRLTIRPEGVLRGILGLMLCVGSISFVEPSPYEIVFFVLFPLVILGHLVITRVTLALFFIVALFLVSEIVSLAPYFEHDPIGTDLDVSGTPLIYTLQTIYLFVSAVMFAIIFTRHTPERLDVALRAYAISCVFAAAWAIAAYMGVPGFTDRALIVNRVSGPFKDPNVLGSYCVLGALFIMQSLLIGTRRHRLFKVVALAIVLFGGIVLPFSRGAWGAIVVGAAILGVTTYRTAESRATRRTLRYSLAGILLLIGATVAVIALTPSLSETFSTRAKLEQDYDGGATGRFGNQLRSLPMLMERPFGFGPHRFAVYFGLDPHNSYIGAFSSAGWTGGAAFMLLVVVTSILALRQALEHSPYLRQAQVFAPALISAFLQAFQIDIDHWRFVYLMLGAVWGMEAARRIGRSRLAPRHARKARYAETLTFAPAPSPEGPGR